MKKRDVRLQSENEQRLAGWTPAPRSTLQEIRMPSRSAMIVA
jgi:hypothetical protein